MLLNRSELITIKVLVQTELARVKLRLESQDLKCPIYRELSINNLRNLEDTLEKIKKEEWK